MRSLPNNNPACELEIEKLVYGGTGLGKVGGKVWLVPLTAPGELVSARAVRDRGNRVEAVLAGIIRPSPDRREPPCRHYGECGGCQLQHMSYAAQCAARTGFVLESFSAQKMELPAVPDFLPSPFELGYRNRAQFGVISKKIGFLKRMSGDLVEVEECPLLLPGLNKSVQEFRKAAEASPASFPLGRMFAIEGEKRDVAAEPSPGGRWLSGVTWTVGGISFKCAPEVFFQSNAHLLEPFQALVCDEAGGGHAVDLYGGNGFFALKLARSFKSVTVIEENRAAVALGRESARLAGIGNVRFQVSRVEDVDPETMVPKADLAIVDPPRAGLSNRAMAVLKSMNPRRITYVSCDPTSMARDVRKLAEAGWKLCRVAIADMFPQTYHVETVAFMSRIN